VGYGDVSGCQGLAVAKPDDEALFAHRTGEWGGMSSLWLAGSR